MIDFRFLCDSIAFYEKHAFVRIETPWTVSKAVSDLTRPQDLVPYQLEHNKKCLVGSGEQSFLYLYLKGFLPRGKFQTITPCFRDDQFDTLHSKYFIKNELIVTTESEVNVKGLRCVLDLSRDFFAQYIDQSILTCVSTGEDQWDICCKGIELGSYGIRDVGYLRYIYATGCAEPRLSTVVKMIDNGVSQKRNN